MSWGFGWKPYVSAAQRRAKAARETARIRKTGKELAGVQPAGRKIATTFWGKAWCDNLEAYSDYENRLPRGRTYVRNGSVLDLQISPGEILALVQGSDLYKIRIQIQPLAKARWQSILTDCAGKIDSLIELLQGRLSAAVMQIVTRSEQGLFPAPKEISLACALTCLLLVFGRDRRPRGGQSMLRASGAQPRAAFAAWRGALYRAAPY
jgi:hypothetical protein